MYYKRLLWLTALVCGISPAFSQTLKREYQVGDTLPDFEIKNIINYAKTNSKVSDFKGKLLILDFWATWCGPCIAAMPKMDSLQKIYQDKVQILPIAYEDSATVATFIGRLSKLKQGLKLPSVVGDNFWRYRFKHSTLPHYVWINEMGKVIAITESKDLNAVNLSNYFKDGSISYTLKSDGYRTLVEEPAFHPSIQVIDGRDTTVQLITDSDLVIHTVLTNFVDGLGTGATFRDSTYLSVRNTTIANLYKTALFGNGINTINTQLVEVEITDPKLYALVKGRRLDGTRMTSGIETLEWMKENAFCYESKVPPLLSKERFIIMKEELNRYFGIKYGIVGEKEMRKAKSLALIRISEEVTLGTKGGDADVEMSKLSFRMKNLPIQAFIDRMSLPLQTYPPVIDETNYAGKLDMELNCNLSDLDSLNNELKKYGLVLIEKDSMREVGVIRLAGPYQAKR